MAVPGLAFSNWGSDKPPEAFYPLTLVAPIAPAPNVLPSTGVRRHEAPLRRCAPPVESSSAVATDREAPAGGGLAFLTGVLSLIPSFSD